MPEDPDDGQGEANAEQALEAEIGEFEAALKKQVDDARRIPHVEEPLETPPAGSFPTAEEIESRLSKAVDDAESYLGPVRHDAWMREQEERNAAERPEEGVHSEFTERIDSFDERYGKLKASKESEKAKQKRLIQNDGESARGLGFGMSIAYTIIGMPLFGAVVGWLIDGSLGTKTWQGICVLIGAVAGVAMAIFIMNRANRTP